MDTDFVATACADFALPASHSDWVEQVTNMGLLNRSVHQHKNKPGSKIEPDQFLLLRAIWPNRSTTGVFEKKSKAWLTTDNHNKAVNFLKRMKSWDAYLASLHHNRTFSGPAFKDGTFALVRLFQGQSWGRQEGDALPTVLCYSPPLTRAKAAAQRDTSPTPATQAGTLDLAARMGQTGLQDTPGATSSMQTPSETSFMQTPSETSFMGYSFVSSMQQAFSPVSGEMLLQFKAIEDEFIVNTALILLLNALTIHCRDVEGQWTVNRQAFVLRNRQKEKMFEARVDGVFQVGSNAKIIVEVKPYLRQKHSDSVRMQEAAQMATWISSDPPPPSPAGKSDSTHRRMIVSQDHFEVYVTVASFTDEYVRYVSGEPVSDITGIHSLLSLQEYGVFPMNDKNEVERFGRLMLAFSIQGGFL